MTHDRHKFLGGLSSAPAPAHVCRPTARGCVSLTISYLLNQSLGQTTLVREPFPGDARHGRSLTRRSESPTCLSKPQTTGSHSPLPRSREGGKTPEAINKITTI